MKKEIRAERTLPASQFFAGTRQVAAAATLQLAPHVNAIHSAWIRLLKEQLKVDRTVIRMFSGLKLRPQYKNLQTGNFNAYAFELERQGEFFDGQGIAVELGVAALMFYFEACLPYLSDDGQPLPAGALARFISASQLSMILGFSRRSEQRSQRLEQRLLEAEQHFRRFSVHVVGLYEQTGRRIARDLHDEIGHNLLVLKLYLELMSVDLKDGHSEQIGQKIEEAVSLIAHAIDGVRRLAFNLGPAILEEAGFIPTLRRYASQFSERTGITVHVYADISAKLPSIYEVAMYRVLQGALSNVVAHSRAAKVEVRLSLENEQLLMSVEDDGKGFDTKKTLSDPSQAFGLMTIRQRVELLGGKLQMESRTRRAGSRRSGTKIEVRIPVEGIEAA